MIVTYRQEGSEEQTWEFIPGRVKVSRMEMIEKRWAGGADPDSGPMSYRRWLAALEGGETRARRVLLWHFLQQVHPTLSIDDVDFYDDELTVELTKDELGQLIDAVRKGRRPAHEKERIIATLIDQQAKAPEGVPGKAILKSGDESTAAP